MEHAEALERIEIAAAEPDGLDRLMAGDTADAAAIAGHLAGCSSCVAEMARIRSTAEIAREVIRSQPDPSLRARTLAYVAAVGVRRGEGGVVEAPAPAGVMSAADGPVAMAAAMPPSAGPAPVPLGAVQGEPAGVAPASLDAARARRRSRLAWLVAAAAVVVVAAGIGFAVRDSAGAGDVAARDRQIVILQGTAAAALRVQAQPDAQHVPLVATAEGGDASGTLAFSPTTGELVAVATDLAPAAAGQEYGCWIEVDGTRRRIGKMYPAGDLWSWAGPVDGLADVPAGAVFGVSLGPVGGGPDNTPVLTGEL